VKFYIALPASFAIKYKSNSLMTAKIGNNDPLQNFSRQNEGYRRFTYEKEQ
jgi:hypothetical protein